MDARLGFVVALIISAVEARMQRTMIFCVLSLLLVSSSANAIVSVNADPAASHQIAYAQIRLAQTFSCLPAPQCLNRERSGLGVFEEDLLAER